MMCADMQITCPNRLLLLALAAVERRRLDASAEHDRISNQILIEETRRLIYIHEMRDMSIPKHLLESNRKLSQRTFHGGILESELPAFMVWLLSKHTVPGMVPHLTQKLYREEADNELLQLRLTKLRAITAQLL